MKVELIKETKPNGDIMYWIEKDGQYVEYSVTHNLEQAEKYFTDVQNGNDKLRLKETIKTIVIDD